MKILKKIKQLIIFTLIIFVVKFSYANNLEYVIKGIQDYYETRPLIAQIKDDIEQNPTLADNYIELAYIYDLLKLYPEEIKTLKKAILYYADGREGRDLLFRSIAECYIKLNKWSKAKPYIEKALTLNPDNLDVKISLAEYYINVQDLDAVAKIMKDISKTEKTRDVYYELYMYLLGNYNNFGPIIKVFEKCVNLDPDNYMARRAYGVSLRWLGDVNDLRFEQALQELRKSLELNNQYIPTYISLADTYMLRSFYRKDKDYLKYTAEWFEKAYKIKPDDVRLSYAMGNFALYREDYDEAIKKIEYAFDNGFKDIQVLDLLARAYNNKAYSYYEKGEKFEEGLKYIEEAINIKPYDGIIIGTKAELLFKLGKIEEAYKFIKKALELEPENKDIQASYKMIEDVMKKDKLKKDKNIK